MVGLFCGMLALGIAAPFVTAAPEFITITAPFAIETPSLTAKVVGVGSQGRTTYALDEPVTLESSTVTVTATLVKGSDYISYGYSKAIESQTVVGGFDCALTGGNAVCTNVYVNTDSPTATTVTSLGPIVLDIKSSATPAGTVPVFSVLISMLLAYNLV
ncbi:hypothetical protein DFH09DRAFT_1182782 [Mycena vulgaris]|nr:hypothetical protein DFH09DRAFT_1187963 [Mycena vulgaris]KAJ6531564.1 hypothetical protein DFH09DRAFT_1182782 [Mycena vulgaris]